MEARRSELLKEEGGYWSKRMASEAEAAAQLAAAQAALAQVCCSCRGSNRLIPLSRPSGHTWQLHFTTAGLVAHSQSSTAVISLAFPHTDNLT